MINTVAEISTIEGRSGDFSIPESSNLIHRIENRDRDAFDECVSHYGPFVWHLARTFTNTSDQAEALTREIFADVLHYKDATTPRRCDKEIIVGIARLRMLQHLKRPDSNASASA